MKCDKCGQFIKMTSRWSWAMIYDMVHMQPDGEIFRCEKCNDKYGFCESNASPYDGDMTRYQGFSARYYKSKT